MLVAADTSVDPPDNTATADRFIFASESDEPPFEQMTLPELQKHATNETGTMVRPIKIEDKIHLFLEAVAAAGLSGNPDEPVDGCQSK